MKAVSKLKDYFLIFSLFLAAYLVPIRALAQENKDVEDLTSYVNGWYWKFLLPFGTVLAGLVVMYGGITYAMSAGDASKVQRAKEFIYGAISGLVLLIGAAFIVRTITGQS